MLPDPSSLARRLVKHVRRDGGPGSATVRPSKADRARVLESGLFDQTWVEAQLGATFASVEDALDAYFADPGCSPHPLFLLDWIEPRFGRPARGQEGLLWYLGNEFTRRRASTHPLVDMNVIADLDTAYDDPPRGRLVAWLADASEDTPLPAPSGMPNLTLGQLRDASIAAARRWRDEARFRFADRISDDPPPDLVEPAGPPLSGTDGAPLVSIVMPVWNRATVVRTAIESVQAQTHQDWELIVVDDGSDDDSLAVVSGMARFDPRIVSQPVEHGGVSQARNHALAHARGTYVAFLDTDNTWRPGFLQVMLGALERNGWGMAHAALRAERDGQEYFRALEGTHEHLLVASHIDLNVLVARTQLVRDVGGFDESLRRGVDYDLLLHLSSRSAPHLVPYIGADYSDDVATSSRISTDESIAWLSVVAAKHLVDWEHVRAQPRVDGRTSIVLGARMTLRATLRWLRAHGGDVDIEVVVVGVRLPLWHHVALSCVVLAAGNARLVTLGADRTSPTAVNLGFASTTGDRTLVVSGRVDPNPAGLSDLLTALEDPGTAVAQPLVVDPRGVVESAGAGFLTSTTRPHALLRGHSADDARSLTACEVPGALGPVFAVRSSVLVELGGLDPLYGDRYSETDLSLRARNAGLGGTRLRPRARFVAPSGVLPERAEMAAAFRVFDERFTGPPAGSAEVWGSAGFEVVGHHLDALVDAEPDPLDVPMLAPTPVVRPLRAEAVAESPPALRWTIDLASRAGRQGLTWGDAYYGEALAVALRRLGQRVCVDPREARHRESRSFDDVIVVLRGLDVVAPRPECLNVEWIISHPDLVTPAQVAGFDLVYAASLGWADEVTRAWGILVRPLLQATDPSLFNADRAEFDTGEQVLFVGNTRGIYRSSVRLAVGAGAEVAVHGQGWRDLLPPTALRSSLVANDELGALYAAASVVLNDHWEDMRLQGFVSNRLMDAAASGARVVSDTVPGVDLHAMFHGLVLTVDDELQMAQLLGSYKSAFPDGQERVDAARQVAAEHSFDVRAEVILTDVLRARGAS